MAVHSPRRPLPVMGPFGQHKRLVIYAPLRTQAERDAWMPIFQHIKAHLSAALKYVDARYAVQFRGWPLIALDVVPTPKKSADVLAEEKRRLREGLAMPTPDLRPRFRSQFERELRTISEDMTLDAMNSMILENRVEGEGEWIAFEGSDGRKRAAFEIVANDYHLDCFDVVIEWRCHVPSPDRYHSNLLLREKEAAWWSSGAHRFSAIRMEVVVGRERTWEERIELACVWQQLDEEVRGPPTAAGYDPRVRLLMATELHEVWRKPRLLPDGTYDPRWKTCASGDYDIANLTFAFLPPEYQRANYHAAHVACLFVEAALSKGVDIESATYLEAASAHQHDDWMRENSWCDDPLQMCPYGELSEMEKEKDREVCRIGMKHTDLYLRRIYEIGSGASRGVEFDDFAKELALCARRLRSSGAIDDDTDMLDVKPTTLMAMAGGGGNRRSRVRGILAAVMDEVQRFDEAEAKRARLPPDSYKSLAAVEESILEVAKTNAPGNPEIKIYGPYPLLPGWGFTQRDVKGKKRVVRRSNEDVAQVLLNPLITGTGIVPKDAAAEERETEFHVRTPSISLPRYDAFPREFPTKPDDVRKPPTGPTLWRYQTDRGGNEFEAPEAQHTYAPRPVKRAAEFLRDHTTRSGLNHHIANIAEVLQLDDLAQMALFHNASRGIFEAGLFELRHQVDIPGMSCHLANDQVERVWKTFGMLAIDKSLGGVSLEDVWPRNGNQHIDTTDQRLVLKMVAREDANSCCGDWIWRYYEIDDFLAEWRDPFHKHSKGVKRTIRDQRESWSRTYADLVACGQCLRRMLPDSTAIQHFASPMVTFDHTMYYGHPKGELGVSDDAPNDPVIAHRKKTLLVNYFLVPKWKQNRIFNFMDGDAYDDDAVTYSGFSCEGAGSFGDEPFPQEVDFWRAQHEQWFEGRDSWWTSAIFRHEVRKFYARNRSITRDAKLAAVGDNASDSSSSAEDDDGETDGAGGEGAAKKVDASAAAASKSAADGDESPTTMKRRKKREMKDVMGAVSSREVTEQSLSPRTPSSGSPRFRRGLYDKTWSPEEYEALLDKHVGALIQTMSGIVGDFFMIAHGDKADELLSVMRKTWMWTQLAVHFVIPSSAYDWIRLSDLGSRFTCGPPQLQRRFATIREAYIHEPVCIRASTAIRFGYASWRYRIIRNRETDQAWDAVAVQLWLGGIVEHIDLNTMKFTDYEERASARSETEGIDDLNIWMIDTYTGEVCRDSKWLGPDTRMPPVHPGDVVEVKLDLVSGTISFHRYGSSISPVTLKGILGRDRTNENITTVVAPAIICATCGVEVQLIEVQFFGPDYAERGAEADDEGEVRKRLRGNRVCADVCVAQ